MKLKHITVESLVCILIMIFAYTTARQLGRFNDFRLSLGAQPLNDSFRIFLLYAIPAAQVMVILLLVVPIFRQYGLLLSLVLLAVYTAYIILVLTNYYGRKPCSCAGAIKNLTWNSHLYFNLTLVIFNLLALYFHRQLRKKNTSFYA